jgi:hypothetical protein
MKLFVVLVLATLSISQAIEQRDALFKGRGAKVPFVEIEAEHATHNGQVIGNSRIYGQLSSEASGRRAVTLSAVGQHVEFTLPIQANSIVVRYSLPDSPDGKGRDATMELSVGDHKMDFHVTSKYSWYYGGYPFNNNPGAGNPHHFYDENRAMFDKAYPQGTKVKLTVTSTSGSPTFTIDLADFELVGPPHPQPANSISVIAHGADPNFKTDSTQAFQKAVDQARGEKKVVWIPQGHYLLYDHVIVEEVSITGAGPWYSVLGGKHPGDSMKAVGIYGKYAPASNNVHLSNFAIIGDVQERNDNAQVNGIGGALSNTVIDNLWIQHTKVGAWMDGPMNNFTIRNSRILDQTADGVNFHKGVTNSVVENTFLRNLGDDGLAMWAEAYETNNKFLHNTVIVPVLANNIAIYGGNNIEVTGNLLTDTISNGAGIHIANRYPGVNGGNAIKGDITIHENTLLRCGNSDYNWHFGIGAYWFSGQNEAIHANINIKDTDVIDSSYAAISFIEGETHTVNVENMNINGTGTYSIQIQAGGTLNMKNVKASGIQQNPPIYGCGAPLKMTIDGSKDGWFSEQHSCKSLTELHPTYSVNW